MHSTLFFQCAGIFTNPLQFPNHRNYLIHHSISQQLLRSTGFGFITRDSGEDVFVHFRSIRGEGHRVLHDGQRVEFEVSEGDKGLQADDVAVAD